MSISAFLSSIYLSSVFGTVKETVVPSPSLLSIFIFPPCASTILPHTKSPMPDVYKRQDLHNSVTVNGKIFVRRAVFVFKSVKLYGNAEVKHTAVGVNGDTVLVCRVCDLCLFAENSGCLLYTS